jgi:hypothetical protein
MLRKRPPALLPLIAAISSALSLKFLLDYRRLSNPTPFMLMKTGSMQQEKRPPSDVIMHQVIFLYLRPILPGFLFERLLASINEPFLSWDVPFSPGRAESEVLSFCRKWGV